MKGPQFSRNWKDVAYEAIDPDFVNTRVVWHSHRIQGEVRIGPPVPWALAHRQAQLLVAEENRLGMRLNFNLAA
jgi:hypothetical protein